MPFCPRSARGKLLSWRMISSMKGILSKSRPNVGRPKTNGTKPASWLFRSAFALSVYGQKRRGERKREFAIRETVSALSKAHPDLRVSDTEVRRILHAFQPAGPAPVITFELVPKAEKQNDLAQLREITEMFREDLDRLGQPFPQFLWKRNIRESIRVGVGNRPKYDPNF